MSRVQLALNVPDIDEAVAFYTKLFSVEPAKRRDGYANFEIVDPPLKLVLFENPDPPGRLNHLGVEVISTEDVAAHRRRLADAGLTTADGSGTCCFAQQDKVWVDGPDGEWEIYAVFERQRHIRLVVDARREHRSLLLSLDRRSGPQGHCRVRRYCLPGHRRGRLRHRRPTTVAQRHGASTLGELDCYGSRTGRAHPRLRVSVRRSFQPRRHDRRSRLRRDQHPRLRGLHHGPSSRRAGRSGGRQPDVRPTCRDCVDECPIVGRRCGSARSWPPSGSCS